MSKTLNIKIKLIRFKNKFIDLNLKINVLKVSLENSIHLKNEIKTIVLIMFEDIKKSLCRTYIV